MFCGQKYGIIKRGTLLNTDACQRPAKETRVMSEILFENHIIPKTHDRSLVFRIAFPDKCHRGRIQPVQLIEHAGTGVDNKTYAQWHIFLPEQRYVLQDLVFVNAEVFLLEPADRKAFFV